MYDINTIGSTNQLHDVLIAEKFAPYLMVHPNLHTPHKHDFYHIVLFAKGSGTHTIDFEQFDVKANQVYLMIPGQVHSWNFKGAVDGYVINFSAEFLQEILRDQLYPDKFPFFKGVAHDSVIQLSKKAALQTAQIIEQIIDEVRVVKPLQGDVIAAMLVQLLIGIYRDGAALSSNQHPKQNQLLLSGFRKLVEQHYMVRHLPKDYAAMLYITPNYLNGICKGMLGKPAGQVIRERILLEAKRLLVNADLNIEAIATALSFEDNSYFTKFFKKYTGLTPEIFRRQAINNQLQ